MTAATINPNPNEPVVVVNNGVLYINRLSENDAVVVAAVDKAENPAAETQRLLRLGGQVDRLVGSSLDVEVLEGTALRLATNFEGTVDNAVVEITASARKIFDPTDGALPAALTQFRGGLESMLGEKFDPDSKKSIIGKFDEAMRTVNVEQLAKFNRLLDATSPDSPVAKWQADFNKTVKSETAVISEQVRELSERIAVNAAIDEAKKTAANKTTTKGFTFEDALHVLVQQYATPHQDLAVQTGRTAGSSGTMRGDEVVTLNPEDTRGVEVNFVFEAKDKKMGPKAILDELEAALVNRNSKVGVAVFASADIAPTDVPFTTFGNKAILVLDKEDPDPLALGLAYMWARWVSRREQGNGETEIDVQRIEALIDEGRRALQRVSQVKKCHTLARKGIDDATSQVEALASEVVEVLANLTVEINKAA